MRMASELEVCRMHKPRPTKQALQEKVTHFQWINSGFGILSSLETTILSCAWLVVADEDARTERGRFFVMVDKGTGLTVKLETT